MPLYEYECKQCHRHTEKIQKFSDAEITICPHCGGPLERVISAPAIAFKGGGWFKDGYGNAKPVIAATEKAGGDAGSSSGSSSETPTSSSGDSKAAAAPSAPAPAAAPAPATTSSPSSDKK